MFIRGREQLHVSAYSDHHQVLFRKSISVYNRINLINANTLSDENLVMAGIGRNM